MGSTLSCEIGAGAALCLTADPVTRAVLLRCNMRGFYAPQDFECKHFFCTAQKFLPPAPEPLKKPIGAPFEGVRINL
jgi:hypothetical protein